MLVMALAPPLAGCMSDLLTARQLTYQQRPDAASHHRNAAIDLTLGFPCLRSVSAELRKGRHLLLGMQQPLRRPAGHSAHLQRGVQGMRCALRALRPDDLEVLPLLAA